MLFNSAAHASAKLAVSLRSSFCCNKCNVPTFISNARQFDCSFVGPCLVNKRFALSTHTHTHTHKKKFKKKKRGRKEKGNTISFGESILWSFRHSLKLRPSFTVAPTYAPFISSELDTGMLQLTIKSSIWML